MSVGNTRKVPLGNSCNIGMVLLGATTLPLPNAYSFSKKNTCVITILVVLGCTPFWLNGFGGHECSKPVLLLHPIVSHVNLNEHQKETGGMAPFYHYPRGQE